MKMEFFAILLLSFILVIWAKCIRIRNKYKEYEKYIPPKNQISELLKITGIITKVSHYNKYTHRHYYSYYFIRIEYRVNEKNYKKIMFLPGVGGFGYLYILQNEIGILYDPNRPEISYLDIKSQDIENLSKKEKSRFLLEIIIGFAIITIIFFVYFWL